MKFRVVSDDVDEVVTAKSAAAAVTKALDAMQGKRRRFRLNSRIAVFQIPRAEHCWEFVTTEILARIGKMENRK